MQAPTSSTTLATAGRRRIFLADDHPLVREWLTNLIQQQPDLMVCGEADNAAQALESILVQQPDVAVVDIALKNSSGLNLINELKRARPELPVVVLSMYDETYYAEQALVAGARGYVMKRDSTSKVIAAIHEVLQGHLFVSEAVASHLVEHLVKGRRADLASAVETLSEREMQVFQLLGQGRGTRQIGETLGINIKTVQAYCGRIKEKLQVQSATELLRKAVRFHDEPHH